jgi:hypothetical protein
MKCISGRSTLRLAPGNELTDASSDGLTVEVMYQRWNHRDQQARPPTRSFGSLSPRHAQPLRIALSTPGCGRRLDRGQRIERLENMGSPNPSRSSGAPSAFWRRPMAADIEQARNLLPDRTIKQWLTHSIDDKPCVRERIHIGTECSVVGADWERISV